MAPDDPNHHTWMGPWWINPTFCDTVGFGHYGGDPDEDMFFPLEYLLTTPHEEILERYRLIIRNGTQQDR